MSKKDNYQNLASQFIDLWQEQITATMNDPEFIRNLLQLMQGTAFSAREPHTYANPFKTPPGGAAATPDTGDASIAGIERSLAAIEKRLGAIESSGISRKKRKSAKAVAQNGKRSKSGADGRRRSKKKSK